MTFGILQYSIGTKIRAHKRFFRALGTAKSFQENSGTG